MFQTLKRISKGLIKSKQFMKLALLSIFKVGLIVMELSWEICEFLSNIFS